MSTVARAENDIERDFPRRCGRAASIQIVPHRGAEAIETVVGQREPIRFELGTPNTGSLQSQYSQD
jgi:hypothetical protein